MEVKQFIYSQANGWDKELPNDNQQIQLIFCFGSSESYRDLVVKKQITNAFPNAQIVGCSTAGQIFNTQVTNDELILTCVSFKSTQVKVSSQKVFNDSDSIEVGVSLAKKIDQQGLQHLIILSDGLLINGTRLLEGLSQVLKPEVTITGGLAGDGDRFESTQVWHKDSTELHQVLAVAFYGDSIKINYGSFGGWDSFGPERVVTKSENNLLYELDGQSALDLYKRYLGEYAEQLPASALLFPLSVQLDGYKESVVRTILAIDEDRGAMTFAGDVPQNSVVRFMKANFDRLIDGAYQAAMKAKRYESNALALLVSCVGRKMVLHQRVEEEIEAIQEVFGKDCILSGFYSYGEICPEDGSNKLLLHNQTMTITTFYEE